MPKSSRRHYEIGLSCNRIFTSFNQKDYLIVTGQLLLRMRLDLLAALVLCTLELWLTIPKEWILSTKTVSVLGIAMSIFIGFRNTQAISRWWEARTLLEGIQNTSRIWADVLRVQLSDQHWISARTARLIRLQVVLVWLLNFELRNFWHQDLRRMVNQLIQALSLPANCSVRSLSVQRAMEVQHLFRDGWITEMGRRQLVEVCNDFATNIGGLERIRDTPIPPPYDIFVRLINWVFGSQLVLEFKRSGSPTTGILLFLGFLMAERIGAYVEGPFDLDGSSFSLPLNTICSSISEDLVPGELDYGRFKPQRNPVSWD